MAEKKYNISISQYPDHWSWAVTEVNGYIGIGPKFGTSASEDQAKQEAEAWVKSQREYAAAKEKCKPSYEYEV